MPTGGGMGFGAWHVLAAAFWIAVILVPCWRISVKAGFPGWLAILAVIPVVNLGYLYFLAFARWPALRSDD